jgi:hypothetical protein
VNITQHSVFLQDVLRQVTKGELIPASFQRPYVWGPVDVLALVESILRRYPIGGFLVWAPWGQADLSQAGRARLGPIAAAAQTLHTSLLLDGQNRLATIAWLARDLSEALPPDITEQERVTWDNGTQLVCDLARQEIRYVPDSDAADGFVLPVAALLNNSLANRLMRTHWGTTWSTLSADVRDPGLRWFDECTASFREARVVVTEMQGATAAEAKHAFLHICKVGVPMSEQDFEASLAWAF